MSIELGDKVKDMVTGFGGVVVCRCVWLNGCVRFGVQPDKIGKDGKLPDYTWIDEPQLSIVQKAKVKVSNIIKESAAVTQPMRATGGPTPAPTRQKDPTR